MWVRETSKKQAAAAAAAAATTTKEKKINGKHKKSIPLLALENYKNHEQRKGHH